MCGSGFEEQYGENRSRRHAQPIGHSEAASSRSGAARNSARASVRRSSSAFAPMVIRMKSDTRGPEKCRTSTARSRSAADRARPLWLGWRAKTKLALDGRTSNPSWISVAVRLSRFSIRRARSLLQSGPLHRSARRLLSSANYQSEMRSCRRGCLNSAGARRVRSAACGARNADRTLAPAA
jgi:hypothetical protein